MDTVLKQLINLQGKHAKRTLTRLEESGKLTPEIRKIVLDEINDLMRAVLKELGYSTEE